jgi:hypothetical protein
MFITLTCPSYGSVCDDGTPVDPDAYDYQGAARDALHFAALFDRFIQNLRRFAGFDVQYFAVIEPQRRLAPHVHLAVRGTISRSDLRKVAQDRHRLAVRARPAGGWRCLLPGDARADQPQAGRHRRGRQHRQPQTGRAEQPDAVRGRDERWSAKPVKAISWTRPRTLKSVDPRTVVSSAQARRLLAAVGQEGERGERMVVFFGCMYYAALRPEEAVELRPENLVSLPDQGWGELLLTGAEPRSGTWWTDGGSARQRRELKHRPRGETRPVPVHPELVALLTQHLKKYTPGPDGRIFTGPRGGIFNDRAYLKIFHRARAAAFTPGESVSLLARRPYDLRHAAVSTWLNAGVPAPQVAEWAGHSVDVLLRVYAKCVSGQQHEAKRRIEEATRDED